MKRRNRLSLCRDFYLNSFLTVQPQDAKCHQQISEDSRYSTNAVFLSASGINLENKVTVRTRTVSENVNTMSGVELFPAGESQSTCVIQCVCVCV